jgi:exportin-7
LDDEESLLESLNMLGQIARCKYHYQELIHQADENTLKEAFPLFEARFSWLVYVMGVFIGNRPVSCSYQHKHVKLTFS